MKTRNTLMSAAVALTVLLTSTGAAFAQTGSTGSQDWGMGVPIDASLDEYMIAALVEELGMSVDDAAAQFESGISLSEIALANGIPAAELDDFLLAVRSQALELAVADGALTAEQAEWLQSVQYGGNGQGNVSGNRTRDLAACVGTCDYSAERQYQNPMAGSPMGRGGRR